MIKLTRIKRFVAAPVFEDEEKTRVARLLNTVVLVFFGVAVLLVVSIFVAYGLPADLVETFTLLLSLMMVLVSLGMLVLVRRGYLQITSTGLLSFVWLATTLWIYGFSGIGGDTSVVAYVLVIVLAGLLLGGRAAIVFTGLSLLAILGEAVLELANLKTVPHVPLGTFQVVLLLSVMGMTGLLLRFAWRSIRDAYERARENERAQIEANRELQAIRASLEDRVVERTSELQRHVGYLEAAAEVGPIATSMLDLDEMLQRVANLIRERFSLYYVGIFLLDEGKLWAELRAGTGEPGRIMRAQGHRLEVGGSSMIGQCTVSGQARIALDVGLEPQRFDNPLLPRTRSEMALPMLSRGQVVGAVSIQSTEEAAFSESDISVLQIMADHVANASHNARLHQEMQKTMRELAEERSLLRTLIDSMPDYVFVKDIESRFLVNNAAHLKVLGVATQDEIVGKTDFDIFPQELATQYYTDEQEIMHSGQPLVSREETIVTSDGQQQWLWTTKVPVRDDGGSIVGLVGVSRDITERRQVLADLEQRSTQLETAAEVSRAASSILGLDELLSSSVNLIRNRLALYYAGIFLIDEVGEFAVLQAGTGEAGQEMLANGHKLEIGDTSMVGWCVVNKEARISLDVDKDVIRYANPLLPDTRSEMALPLISRGQVIGAMTIQSAEEGAFSESDISVLQTMADQLANAIANARLLEESQRRARELEVINEVGQAITSVLEPDMLLRQVVDITKARFGYYFVSIVMVEGERVLYRYGSTIGDSDVRLEGSRTEAEGLRGLGLVLETVRTGRPILINDVLNDRSYLPVPELPDTRSELDVPIEVKGRVIAVLDVQSDRAFAFSQTDAALLQSLANQVGVAIENAQLFQETQANLQEITRLHQRYLREQWDEFLAEEEAQQRASYLFDRRGIRPASDLQLPEVELAMTKGHTLALTPEDEAWRGGDGDAKSALVVPLQLRDQIIGALDFFETEQDRLWTEDDITFVETVAAQVALAMENARAYEELQKTAVELQEMDRLKSQFLANMSHELRTPLNSIIGFSRVMLKGIDGPLTDLQRTDLTSIYNNGQNLLQLINDVLDLSRIEAGKMELVFEPVQLETIIDGVMTTAIGLVKDKPVELIKETADDLPIVRADSTRLRQVILNLISNAAKFTEEGSITVRAWADDENASVSVTDTGIGIPEDKWEKIFKEFEQVDGSATRRHSGTGLGLPISRHFVEMHGGRIWVESEMDKGSTFIFNIPIHGPGYIEDPELAMLKIDSERRLVLAVEDSEEIVGFYRRYLERHGYQVVNLTEGERVPLWVRELSPFAVLLDVNLPDIDGWQVLENLKTSRETSHVPVIICSIVDEEAKGLSLGAAAYLKKPILEGELLQAMAMVAELHTV